MTQSTWNEIASVTVPELPTHIWTLALDHVVESKLYKIVVEMVVAQAGAPATEQSWTHSSGQVCTADGLPNLIASSAPLGECAPGSLIGKIGGSAADISSIKDKVTLFGVGRHCVFSVADAKSTGSLYLGMNDAPSQFSRRAGKLVVKIYEAA